MSAVQAVEITASRSRDEEHNGTQGARDFATFSDQDQPDSGTDMGESGNRDKQREHQFVFHGGQF